MDLLHDCLLLSMPGGTGWIFIIVILAVWLLTVGEIARSTFRDPTNKIVWLLIVILLNLPGMILYFLLGRAQRAARPAKVLNTI